MKNKKDDQSSLLNTKSTLRNIIFVITTLILLPVANLCQALVHMNLSYAQIERYSVELSQENQVHYIEFFANNLDKATPLFLTYLIWIPFTVLGLLLVKLVYHKSQLKKQIFKVTLISHCIKIGLFLILCGGSVAINLINPTHEFYIVNEIIISQINGGLYRANWLNVLLDIAFTISFTWGMLYIYRTQIRHGIIKTLGGKVG